MRVWNTDDDEIISTIASENDVDEYALTAYVENIHYTTEGIDDWDDVISSFRDAFVGEYQDVEDFLRGASPRKFAEIPDWVVPHVDWDSVWDCELRHDFFEQNGHYFRNI